MLIIKPAQFSLKSRLVFTLLVILLPLALAAVLGFGILHRTVVRDFVDASYRQQDLLIPLQRLQLLMLQIEIPLEEYLETGKASQYDLFQARRQAVETSFPALLDRLEGENKALLERTMADWQALNAAAIDLLASQDADDRTAFLTALSRFDNIQASAHDKLEAIFNLVEQDIQHDYDEAALGLERSQWIAGISAALALLLTGAGVVYFSHTILEGVQRLIEGADRFAEGDRDHQIDIQIPPELHKVAEEFNKMIGIIRVSEDKLIEQARRDKLTGLRNRVAYEESIDEAFSRHSRLGESLALVSLDIDFFKKVNDDNGHDAGDLVLKHVARIMEASVRDIDKVFRLGGEEFTLLLPGATAIAARSMGERIRHDIENSEVAVATRALKITVSLGVALLRVDDTPETLAKRADTALYEAKQRGRNRVVIVEDEAGS